jgi:hypothetical protein
VTSPFFIVVRDHFDEFEQVYPEKFQDKCEFWRPIILSSIDKYLKCGDLKASSFIKALLNTHSKELYRVSHRRAIDDTTLFYETID